MHEQPHDGETKSFQLAAWEKHEKIAMHFNELILKIRIQALGAVAAIVTIGGVLLKADTAAPGLPWGLLACVFGVLFLFWIAICLLDFLYYNRLLMGAVDCLLGIEKAIADGKPITLDMSHKIESAVLRKKPIHREKGSLWGPALFYLIVGLVLLIAAIYSGAVHIRHQHQHNGASAETRLPYRATRADPLHARPVFQHHGDNETQTPNIYPRTDSISPNAFSVSPFILRSDDPNWFASSHYESNLAKFRQFSCHVAFRLPSTVNLRIPIPPANNTPASARSKNSAPKCAAGPLTCSTSSAHSANNLSPSPMPMRSKRISPRCTLRIAMSAPKSASSCRFCAT